MTKIKFIILFLIINFFISSNFALAGLLSSDLTGSMVDQSVAVRDGAEFQDGTIGEIIATVIKAVLSLLGLIFISLLIFSGYLWMTAGGNSDQVEKAKQGIFRSIIGLIIIISAYSIMYFVFKYMVK